MNKTFERFRIPILTGAGALVLILVVYLAWISPEGSKASSLNQTKSQLLQQQQHLNDELATFRREQRQLPADCATLAKDTTEIPGTVQADAFSHQVTALAVAAGNPNTPSINIAPPPGGSGVVAVPVTLNLAGNYVQIMTFVKGLETFQRLFTVSSFNLGGGPAAIGGGPPAPGTPNYTLALTGNIYYNVGQTNACTSPVPTTVPATHAVTPRAPTHH
jgi:Tfp pilus assembly protein PilO